MNQFWPDLQLPTAKIKKPWATAECDKIPKLVKIICFYVNTHVLKSEPGYFVTFSHRFVHIISKGPGRGKLSPLLLDLRRELHLNKASFVRHK